MFTPQLLYTIPVFHNPTGATLSASRRYRLVQLARKFGFIVVADEVYQMTGDLQATPPPLRSLDEDYVISLGSFSKILGPGVRLGWIEAGLQHIAILRGTGALRSGGGVAPVTSAIVESLIGLGIQDQYLEKIRQMYMERRCYLSDLLASTLPSAVRFSAPRGGFYIWLELPIGIDAAALVQQAATGGVSFRPGALFSCKQAFPNYLRVCFTYYDERRLRLGAERLVNLLRAHM